MSGSDGVPPVNNAVGGANVDVQAGTIYDGVSIVHYHMAPYDIPGGASGEAKFREGVRHLSGHRASAARTLIWAAMMKGYETSEARFYWLIAMLSERTIRQFSGEEIAQLRQAAKQQPAVTSNSWEDGTRLIFQLLESITVLPADPRPDVAQVVQEFGFLSRKQRNLLLPHLELFLDGPLKDDVWRQERASAESGQASNNRRGRAWKFFQPIPAEPRIPAARPVATTAAELLIAKASILVLAVAAGFFGWELIADGAFTALLLYVLALAGGAVAAVTWWEIVGLAERRRRGDERLTTPPPRSAPPRAGFAAKVDALFSKYAAKGMPDKNDRANWEVATAGLRRYERDEIVAQYRESRIGAERVAWLVRYRIRQSRKLWRSGELYAYRQQFRPRRRALVTFRIGTAAAAAGGVGTVAVFSGHPLADVAGAIATLLGGLWAWRNWLRIDLEKQRVAAEAGDSAERTADAEQEFRRWNDVLEDTPTDAEMASWLECDRTVLLARAIDHYRLARHQVITHAFLEGPDTGTKRARVKNGPMRYSRYRLVVFLLTGDGVRQMSAALRFMTADVHEGDRFNFRYDAVASARVSLMPRTSDKSRIQQKFKLTLVNGELFDVLVTDLDPADFQPGEDARSLESAALDAASVANTLHVLEGIAAEGKAWLWEQRVIPAPVR